MIVSINQPAYLPWPGYFDRIVRSDVHVILDHVQFEKNSFVNRNYIRSGNAAALLTIPLKTKGKFGDLAINTLQIDESKNWRKKHLRTIEQNYKGTAHFQRYFSDLEFRILNHSNFIELICSINDWLLRLGGSKALLLKSSELDLSSAKSDLILDICLRVGATKYLSGPFGKNYLELEKFSDQGIDIEFTSFKFESNQDSEKTMLPNFSLLDLLFREGEEALCLLFQK